MMIKVGRRQAEGESEDLQDNQRVDAPEGWGKRLRKRA